MGHVRFRRWLARVGLALLLPAGAPLFAQIPSLPPLHVPPARDAVRSPAAPIPTEAEPPVAELPTVVPAYAVPALPVPVHAAPAHAAPAHAVPVQAAPVPTASVPTAPIHVAPADPNVLPIGLDTVLRMAQDHNGQVRLARARLEEADVKQGLAERRWLPDLLVGPSGWRHEGGIQDFEGRLIRSSYGSLFAGLEVRGKLDVREVIYRRIEAERGVIQQRGELSKLTNEQLLDATSTYVDLLAARTALAVSNETEARLADLLVQARKLAAIDPGLRVELVRIDAESEAQKVLARKLQEGAESAKLKLLYTLGLDPAREVAVLDQITIFHLVDDRQPAEALIEQALRTGPGVEEMNRLLVLVDRMQAQTRLPQHYLPTVEVSMWEGAFGAGPGSRLDWSNRWDLGVNLRWSVNDLLTSRDKQRLLETQRTQAYLSHQELRNRLSLGVRQALEELRSSQDQVGLAIKHIERAEESYKLSDQRLRENIKGRSPSEVLLAVRSLFAARMSYLHALRDYDKAQLRLFVLTGSVIPGCR